MRLTQQQLEAYLWGAANILRGKTAGQDYKNYIDREDFVQSDRPELLQSVNEYYASLQRDAAS